jgi:hypothetical protein
MIFFFLETGVTGRECFSRDALKGLDTMDQQQVGAGNIDSPFQLRALGVSK